MRLEDVRIPEDIACELLTPARLERAQREGQPYWEAVIMTAAERSDYTFEGAVRIEDGSLSLGGSMLAHTKTCLLLTHIKSGDLRLAPGVREKLAELL